MNRHPLAWRTRRLVALVLVVLSLALPAVAAPATRPAATHPATTQSADLKRLMELTRQSLRLFEEKKIAQAAVVLEQALAIEPESPLNLYNMACAQALLGRPGQAFGYLERAAEVGFTDFQHVERDPDLISVRKLPEYAKLLGRREELLRKSADRVLDALREQFGDGYLYEIDPANKLIFATNTDQRTLTAMKQALLAQAVAQRKQLFDHTPEQYVTVVLPSPKDYRKLSPSPAIEGFFNPEMRILVASNMGQVLTHEFTHALHHADLTAIGQDHPIWLTEGLATLFEAARFQGEAMVPDDNLRLSALQAAARARRLIPLDELLKMTPEQFMRNPLLSYGQSGSLLLYLHDRNLLKQFYDAVKASFDKDPTGLSALEQVTGEPLGQVEKDWQAWMLKRTPPALTTGRGGAFLGVRFGAANDGLRVEEIVARGPASEAGLKPDDVIVDLDGQAVRDYPALMREMTKRKAGDKIVLGVRRDRQYSQLPLTLGSRPEEVVEAAPPPRRPRRQRRTPATTVAPRPATNPAPATAP